MRWKRIACHLRARAREQKRTLKTVYKLIHLKIANARVYKTNFACSQNTSKILLVFFLAKAHIKLFTACTNNICVHRRRHDHRCAASPSLLILYIAVSCACNKSSDKPF